MQQSIAFFFFLNVCNFRKLCIGERRKNNFHCCFKKKNDPFLVSIFLFPFIVKGRKFFQKTKVKLNYRVKAVTEEKLIFVVARLFLLSSYLFSLLKERRLEERKDVQEMLAFLSIK